MVKKTLLLWCFCGLLQYSWAQAFLQLPIDGQEGLDWIIVNYVDWDTVGFKDHSCGSKSYDGHQGTDFSIRSFKQMDEEVPVYAAANGRVTFTKDGEFDRETSGDVTKKLGNYVAIRHPNKYYSYYGHLKKNSIAVSSGDSVNAGDLIGYVGSSGNSTDPHLHFELWYDSLYVVDPFAGDCGNSSTLFINPPTYDTSVSVWESGLHLKNDLTIGDLRERIITINKPYTITPSSDSALNFWAHAYGLREGKDVTVTWYTPANAVWFTFSVTLDRDYWYYYYWSFINHTDLEEGTWNVRLNYDGQEIAQEEFEVSKTASVQTVNPIALCQKIRQQPISQLRQNSTLEIELTDLQGITVQDNIDTPLAKGIYLLKVKTNKEHCVLKRGIN